MKKYVLTFVLGIFATLGCIAILISPWWHGFISPTKNAHCLPIEYPEYPFNNPDYADPTVIPYRPYVFRTETSLATVQAFYEAHLAHVSDWKYEVGDYWTRSEVRPGEFLYECGGGLNWEEAEMGCIYIRERDGKTVIERIWLYSATSAPPCDAYMSELP